MSGRAGRRGIDERGIVIMIVDEKLEPEIGKGLLKVILLINHFISIKIISKIFILYHFQNKNFSQNLLFLCLTLGTI